MTDADRAPKSVVTHIAGESFAVDPREHVTVGDWRSTETGYEFWDGVRWVFATVGIVEEL